MFSFRAETAADPIVLFQLAFPEEIPSDQRRGVLAIKQKMRRAFSVYLRRVWRQEKGLADFIKNGLPSVPYPNKRAAPDDEQYPFYSASLAGYTWIPLVSRRNRLKVSLTIELLSPSPGVLKPNGDLDNRLKVILDSLRMVRQQGEVEPQDRGNGEDLYVLLEDDSLIEKLDVLAVESLGSPQEHRVTIDVKVTHTKWHPHPALPLLL